MRSLVLLLGFLSVLATSTSYSTFKSWPWPENECQTYRYEAKIEAGTETFADYASVSYISGLLDIYSLNDYSLFFHLRNITNKYSTGELNETTYKYDSIVFDEHQNQFYFYVNYTNSYEIKAIEVPKNEPALWTNLKKSIASVWQMPYFNSTAVERTVYGSMDTHYFMYDVNKKFQSLEKSFDFPSKGYPIESDSNEHKIGAGLGYLNYRTSDSSMNGGSSFYEQPFTLAQHSIYSIHKESGFIESIENYGSIRFYPFKGKSFSYHVLSEQKFSFYELNTGFDYSNYQSKFSVYLDFITFYDLTFDYQYGGYNFIHYPIETTSEGMFVKLQHYLLGIVKYYDAEMTDGSVFEKVLSFTETEKAFKLMERFALKDWIQIYENFEIKKEFAREFKVLKNLIPFVGTSSSSDFLKFLIRKAIKIEEKYSVYYLSRFARHLHQVSMHDVNEWSEVFDWKDLKSDSVYKAALLAFATLLSRFSKNHIMPSKTYKYVEHYGNLMKTSNEYRWQLFYLHCLRNIGTYESMHYLEHIIYGVEGFVPHLDSNIRLQAIHASTDFYTTYSNHTCQSSFYSAYWAVLSNRREPIDLRMAAYTSLMSNPHLSYSSFYQVFWLMSTEMDAKLYNLHYSTLKAYSDSTNKYYQKFGLLCHQFLSFTPEPAVRSDLNSMFLYDYRDPSYGYGGGVQFFTTSTAASATFFSEFSMNFFNAPFKYYSVFFKVSGLETLQKPFQDTFKVLEINEVFRFLKSLAANKNIHIEFVLCRHGDVIKAEYFDHSTINEFLKEITLFSLRDETQQSLYEFDSLCSGELVVPSAIGFPVTLAVKVPKQTFMNKHTMSTATTATTSLKYQFESFSHGSIHSYVSLSYDNPFSKYQMGVRRNFHFDYRLPIYFEVTFNWAQSNFKFSFSRSKYFHQTKSFDTFDIQSYVYDFVYATNAGMSDPISIAYISDHPDMHSMAHANHPKTIKLFDHDFENFGVRFEGSYFDCERDMSESLFWQKVAFIANQYTKNYDKNAFAYFYLTARNLLSHMIVSPSTYNCGIMFRLEPSKQYPVHRIDVVTKYTTEVIMDQHRDLPGYDFKLNWFVSIKNHEKDVDPSSELKEIKTWDCTFDWSISPGHKSYYFNLFAFEKYMISSAKSGIRFHFNGNGHYEDKMIFKTYNMSYNLGSSSSVHDSFMVNVTAVGQLSKEQLALESDHVHELSAKKGYVDCRHQYHWLGHSNYHSSKCASKYFEPHHYKYDISIKDVHGTYRTKYIDWFSKYFWSAYGWRMQSLSNVMWIRGDRNRFKYEITYPIERPEQFDVTLYVPSGVWQLDGLDLPFAKSFAFGFSGENFFYSKMFSFWSDFGVTNECNIDGHTGYFSNRWFSIPKKRFSADGSWILFMSGNETNTKSDYAIYGFMKEYHLMKLKVMMEDKHLEIAPIYDDHYEQITHGFNLTLNGHQMPAEFSKTGEYKTSIFDLKILHNHFVVLKPKKFGFYLEYDGHFMHANFALMKNVPLYGHCF